MKQKLSILISIRFGTSELSPVVFRSGLSIIHISKIARAQTSPQIGVISLLLLRGGLSRIPSPDESYHEA
jgi:hypothetical protein